MTMGRSWAWNPDEQNWKTSRELLRNLVSVVSHGGNFLLNVGPTARGVFPPEAVERLRHMGRWLQTYPDSIYGSTYTPLQGLTWGQATRKADRLYLHIFEWPANNRLDVGTFPYTAQSVSLYTGEALAFTQAGQHLEITVPQRAPDPDVSVLVIRTAGPG